MECSVCFEVYDQASHKPVSLPCGHILCDACIPVLGDDSPSCPTCRLPFSKDQEAVNGIRHLYLDLQDCHSRDEQDGLTSPQKEEAGHLAAALRSLSVDAPVHEIEHTLAAVRGWVPSVTRIKDLETKVVLSRLLFNVEVLQSKFKDIKRLRSAAALAKRQAMDAQTRQETSEAVMEELRGQNAALKKGSIEAGMRHRSDRNAAVELRRKDDELQEAQKFTALLLDQLQQSQSKQQTLQTQLSQAHALLDDTRRNAAQVQQQVVGGNQRNDALARIAEQHRTQAVYWKQQADLLQRDLDQFRRGQPAPLMSSASSSTMAHSPLSTASSSIMAHAPLSTTSSSNGAHVPMFSTSSSTVAHAPFLSSASSPTMTQPMENAPSPSTWTYPSQFTFSAPPAMPTYSQHRASYSQYPPGPIASSSRVPLERLAHQSMPTYAQIPQGQKRPLEADGVPPLVSAPKRVASGAYAPPTPSHQTIPDMDNFMFNLPPS